MSAAKNQKRRKKPKISKGIHGGGGEGRALTQVEKVNMVEGGMLRTFKPIGSVRHVEVAKPDVETAKRAMHAMSKAVAR